MNKKNNNDKHIELPIPFSSKIKNRILSYFSVQEIDNMIVNWELNIADEFSGFFYRLSLPNSVVQVSVVACKGGINHDAALHLVL